jgi:hypothetical protein
VAEARATKASVSPRRRRSIGARVRPVLKAYLLIKPRTSGAEAVRDLAPCTAIVRSHTTRRPVDLTS